MFFDHSSRMFWLISYSSFYSDVAVCQPIISYIFFGRVIISVLDCSVFPLCLLVLSRLFCRSSAALCSSSTVSLFSFRFCCPFFLPFPNVCWDNSTFSRQIVLSFYCGAVFNRLCPPHQQPSREERLPTSFHQQNQPYLLRQELFTWWCATTGPGAPTSSDFHSSQRHKSHSNSLKRYQCNRCHLFL